MANFQNIVKHVKVSEGGHSSDPRDKALRQGHSGVLGKGYDNRFPSNFVHTNKGVIWATYLRYCKKVGKQPSGEEFVTMTDTLWRDIAYTLYWESYDLNNVNSQAIAEIIFEGYWGGGGTRLVRDLQRELNNLGFVGKNGSVLAVDGFMGGNSTFALNNATRSYQTEKDIIKHLTDQRLVYLQSLDDWSIYGKGWGRRVNEMYEKAMKLASVGRITGIAVVSGLFFLAYKAYEKKLI